MTEAELEQAARGGGSRPLHEGRQHAGPGAPGDVKTRHRVTVPERDVTAALGPADHGEEAHAARAQPRALLARGEIDVGLRPSAGPKVFGAIEPGAAHPVRQG